MTTTKFALTALLLGASATASAGVPVIELSPFTGANVKRVQHLAQAGADRFARAAAPQLVGQRVPLMAMQASAMPAAAAAAPVAAASVMPAAAAGTLVAVRPQPSIGALLLLALGCIIYQGRRRRHGFAVRPLRNLRERNEHAPALA